MKTLLVVLLSILFLSCKNNSTGTDSAASNGTTVSTMTGKWKGASTAPNIDLTMTLTQNNDKSITGSGYIWSSSAAVTGTNDYPTVSLVISASFQNAEFSGTFKSPNTISGTFNFQGTDISNFTLIRQ